MVIMLYLITFAVKKFCPGSQSFYEIGVPPYSNIQNIYYAGIVI